VNDKQWPTEADRFRFADEDLSPEQLRRLERHLEHCSSCAKEVAALQELVGDIAAPVASGPLDVAGHVAGVMERLDTPVSSTQGSRWAVFCGAVAAAAAVALVVATRGPEENAPDGAFVARGARSEASLSRDVGVKLYAHEASLRPLEAGSRVRVDAALTAGVRNLGSTPVHLLLFAVDRQHSVHWIAPAFTTAGTDPEAVVVAPSPAERLLPTAAAFDDLAPGSLRVVAILSPEPVHVSNIETLPASELVEARLQERFPRADIRQVRLEVTREVTP